MSIRVIAGEFKGRRLKVPRSGKTRPTADRTREALFSALGPLDGLAVLDLFAGSGALGIEALSRGAVMACFVDSDPRSVSALKDNLTALERSDSVALGDALSFLRHADRQFDLVFLDPPYRLARELSVPLSDTLHAVLNPKGRIVCESDHRDPLVLDFKLQWERRYGDTLIRIYQP